MISGKISILGIYEYIMNFLLHWNFKICIQCHLPEAAILCITTDGGWELGCCLTLSWLHINWNGWVPTCSLSHEEEKGIGNQFVDHSSTGYKENITDYGNTWHIYFLIKLVILSWRMLKNKIWYSKNPKSGM